MASDVPGVLRPDFSAREADWATTVEKRFKLQPTLSSSVVAIEIDSTETDGPTTLDRKTAHRLELERACTSLPSPR